jgi:hypothetical protein
VCHLWVGVAVHKARKSTPSQDFPDWVLHVTLSDKVLILVGFLDGTYIS